MQNQLNKAALHHFGAACLMLAACLTFFCTPIHAEEQEQTDIFKSSEFLKWERQNQEFYIHTSVGMAGLIVGQTSKKQSKCIDDWYFKAEQASVDYILDVMRQHSEFHPRGIILAVMEKKCGKFIYTE